MEKKNNSQIRYCKSKKCKKELPKGYKHKYCEACRNKHAASIKRVGKAALGVAGTAASIVVVVATQGNINPKDL